MGTTDQTPLRVARAGSSSTDGRTATIELETPDGERFKLDMAVELLAPLRNVISNLSRESRGIVARGQDRVFPQLPQVYTIAESQGMRGCVLLIFDAGLPTENAVALPDAKALEFAAAVEANVFGRMTPQERLAHAKKRNGGLMTPERKIILPGG